MVIRGKLVELLTSYQMVITIAVRQKMEASIDFTSTADNKI